MVLETKPSVAGKFPPPHAVPYRVKTGDDWGSVARRHHLGVWELIEFNFPGVAGTLDFNTKCKEVNWLLRTQVGCTTSVDGKNYAFSSTDKPGLIYLPEHKGESDPCADWKLTEEEKDAIRDIGGAKMLRWAEKKPKKRRESAEFKPTGKYRSDFKLILGWKSCDPSRTCLADWRKNSLQFIWLLRDDKEYWESRMPSTAQAETRRTSQAAVIRDYRDRVLHGKQCPVGAQLALSGLGKSLILTMIWGLLHIIPTPGVPGSSVTKSVATVAGWLAKNLAKYLDGD